MLTKSLTIETMDEVGKGMARIATLSAIDNDLDTYAKGAFGWQDGGQWCSILPAHDRRAMPLGKTRVFEEGDAAFAELHLNLDTQAGKDWHSTLKFDLATGKAVQEWSYGYAVLDSVKERIDGKSVRRIKQVRVDEVSPVLKGAGIGTRTLNIKGITLKDDRFAGLITDLGEFAEALQGDPSMLSATGLKQLGDIHAALGKALAAPADEGDGGLGNRALADHLFMLSSRHLNPG